MDKFDFKKAIKNNIVSSQKAKTNHILNEARITRNVVKSSDLSLVESLSLLSEEEILMEQILAEGEEILSEDFDLLNEGLWSKIKKFAANVIKKDRYSSTPEERERMEAQYQKMMEKTAQGLLKKFMDKFRKTYPEFPNMEDQNKFGEALVDLATFYDSIKHITLKPKDVQNQPISIVQKEIEDGKLDPKLANEIIGDLRAVMMKFIDYDLAPMYKQANEQINEEEEENLLNRAQGGDSKSMQNQKSLKLPAILGLIGGLSALGGILVNAGWFSGLFAKVVENPSVKTVKEAGKVITQTLSPQPGEGFTQMMGRIFLGDADALDPNTTVGELLKVMKDNGVTPEKLAEISDKGKELFLQDWESTIANADPNATLGDTLGPNGLGTGGNLGLALGKKAVAQIVKGAGKAVLTKVAGSQAAGALGALGITAPAAAMTLGILGAGLATAGLVSFAMRKKAQNDSRLQKLQDLRNEMEDLKVPEVLEPVTDVPKTDPEAKPKVPAADDIKMGDWVRYTNDKGQKMLVRISNRMDLNPTELQEADRPAKWGGRFQADVMINLDTGRVSFSGPYALETKDAEKAEDSFVEKTKQSNPKIQKAIDRVDARKSKEDAEKPSDEEGAEEGAAEKGESFKAQKGDLVIAKIGGKQYLLRIGDIVGGEEEEEPESRRGSLGQRARRRATGRSGSGSIGLGSAGLGSGYSGNLGESILRLNEQKYMIDAGMLLNTGDEYLPKKAVDLTVDIARIASDEDIAKAKEEFPEQFEIAFASQEEPADAEEAGDEATSLVNSNVDLIVRFLRKPDKDVSGKLKMLFKPFFEKAGIPWKGGSAVDPIMDLMRQVAVNRKIRSKMTSMVNEQDESRKFAKKVLAEAVRAYKKKNEIKK